VGHDRRSGRRIVALVLTHNAPQSLARCLSAIAAQTERPQGIVVVDNAVIRPCGHSAPSGRSDDASPAIRHESRPAGGWAIALREFLSSDFSHAWVMDDDIVPEPECLPPCGGSRRGPGPGLRRPGVDPTRRDRRPVGLVVWVHDRPEIVEKVGLPREELFWWAEDTEYCHWRIPQAGFKRRLIEEAVVHHDAIRQGGEMPTWKYYYESRNMLYYHLHIMHKVGRFPRNFSRRLVGRAVFRQSRVASAAWWSSPVGCSMAPSADSVSVIR